MKEKERDKVSMSAWLEDYNSVSILGTAHMRLQRALSNTELLIPLSQYLVYNKCSTDITYYRLHSQIKYLRLGNMAEQELHQRSYRLEFISSFSSHSWGRSIE